MAESIKNIALENQVAAQSDHPGIHLVSEYFDEHQPKYQWDNEDNLIAFLHFGGKGGKSLRWVFQKFITERYHLARDTDVLTDETKRLIEETQFEIQVEDVGASNFQIASDEEPEGGASSSYEGESVPKYKKAVWNTGILIDEDFEVSGKKETASGEITFHLFTHKIHIRTDGKEGSHRMLLTKLINWFSSNAKPAKVLAGCNCPQCSQKAFSETYRLDYQVIENLKQMYSPQVQCYKSGDLVRLDAVSSIDTPSAEVALVYDFEDKSSAMWIKKMFKNKPISIKVLDINEALTGRTIEEDFKDTLVKCQYAVVLASADLVGGDESRLKWLETAAARYKKGEIGVSLIEVRDCHWIDAAVFKDWEQLNERSMSSCLNQDEAWKTVGGKLYNKIEQWLHSQAIKNNR